MKTLNNKCHAYFVCVSILLLFSSVIVSAQAPQAIPYQAVARDIVGNLISNQPISIRFSIHDSTANGTVVYKETQSAITNALGLFTANLGQGTAVSGRFINISWGDGSKFMQVEMDASGGNSYVDMGTQQILSVPYSLYSHKASSLDNNQSTPDNIKTLIYTTDGF
ncbi:MAG: hypothetical protein IPN88_16315 [Bacteroidetes bacterium]|nr:hypothetical protein [Bacteroidota bacterium]